VSLRALAVGLLAVLVLAACQGPQGQGAAPAIHILAGSELKDLEPLLPQLQTDTGLHLALDYTGTLDGAERIANGDSHGLAWFSSNRYLTLLPGASAKVLQQQRIMLSPVVIGVKRSTARRFAWENNPNVTWRDIANQAKAGTFKFAMTDPSASNSGFSALVGVASAFAGTGSALQAADIKTQPLIDFFSGQALTAGSSGFLADSYVKDQDSLDAMINYESVLLSLNAEGRLKEPLSLVYPKEGIVTADYPLMLLNSSQRDSFDKLSGWLRKPNIQRKIMTTTSRRPVLSDVGLDPRFASQVLVELPFPATLDVANQLLFAYLDKVRLPSHVYFVLDTSGSMGGQRISDLKRAFANLTGLDTSITGQFARFRSRDQLTIITFSSRVNSMRDFTITNTDPNGADQAAVRDHVNSLQAGGGTAIYDALYTAFQAAGKAKAADPGRFYSVVLMTDGENNQGRSASQFADYYRREPPVVRSIKCFAVIFGEASPKELNDVANLTGGRTFDARGSSLTQVFKDMRGYQ
jgi:Ca-activated chloride channel family protein